jgi:phage tail-like protein
MAGKEYIVASGYVLEGKDLAQTAIDSFEGLEISVEISNLQVGTTQGGQHTLQIKPGPPKPSTPSFTAAIAVGDKKLGDWFKKCNPNDGRNSQLKGELADLTFTFLDAGSPAAQWQLKKCFPMSYKVSSGKADSSELANETITIAVTEIVREK